ncbi:carboxypeptidase-like regulatory domain-containing protein [Winogradskyella sp.]|uniref:carboxypeptidase-like regulatory domain-containing protein n=1 Tax=Winogradskyella sp. TaxID=1883156 RepID=UPI003F6B734D
MNTQFRLDIKKPCSENYDQFQPTKKGSFCDSCQKEVINFTKMNSEEIVTYFKTKSSQNTCGRFSEQQLNSSFNTHKRSNYYSFFTGIAMAVLSFFSITLAEAQEQDKTGTLKDDSKVEDLKNKQKITVKGTVTTKIDGLPLPGASIVLQGTEVGVQTDFEGYFEFPQKLKKGDVLIISYVGMESQKVIIENKKFASNIALKINMNETTCIIMGKVAVKEVFKSKRN